MTENQLLHIFVDVNVNLDAITPWNTSGTPVVIEEPGVTLHGEPPAVVLAAVGDAIKINGQRLVLHTSENVLFDGGRQAGS